MRDRFRGYYRPTDDEFERFLAEGLVVPDANVLLTLYRVSEPTRGAVLDIFRALDDRLWLPHQVAKEFQENRLGVIQEQEEVYEQVTKEISSFSGRVVGKIRRHHPRLDRKEFKKVLDEALEEVREHVEGLRSEHPDPLSGEALGSDVVRDALDEIIGDRIGGAIDQDRLHSEGKKRFARRVPPGYADEKKPESERYGDLAVWLELLREAGKRERPVLFVTEDTKEDWWWSEADRVIGPRPELVQEMKDEASRDFWMYRFEPFLERAGQHFGIEVTESARAEVTRAQEESWQGSEYSVTIASPPFGDTFGQPLASGGFRGWSGSVPHKHPAGWNPFLAGLAGASVSGDLVVLTFADAWPGQSLHCSITHPDGQVYAVDIEASGNMVQLRYPDDFEQADGLSPGSYRYAWYARSAEGPWLFQLADGSFVVDG